MLGRQDGSPNGVIRPRQAFEGVAVVEGSNALDKQHRKWGFQYRMLDLDVESARNALDIVIVTFSFRGRQPEPVQALAA